MAGDPFSIRFRPEVEEDLRRIGKSAQSRILRAIEDRLSSEPTSYGKPLGGPLAGLRRVRVGDYRIAYQVKGSAVIVWAVKHRRDVYEELERRFQRH